MSLEEVLAHEMQHAKDLCGKDDCPEGYSKVSPKCCANRMCHEMKAYFCGDPGSYGEDDWDKLANRAMASMDLCKNYWGADKVKEYAKKSCPTMPKKEDCFVTPPLPPATPTP
jgi:hypothetical protein